MSHVINIRALTSEKPCINKAIHALLMHGYAINIRALTSEKPCINKAIHALLMHGYATFHMIVYVPGPQICCRYEMCTARP